VPGLRSPALPIVAARIRLRGKSRPSREDADNFIFDKLGSSIGCWIWDQNDLRTLSYLNAVPVTSNF
jgi:hypothetical protein